MSLPVTVHEISFPMCLVAASVGHSRAIRPRTEGIIPAWPLHQAPRALSLCSVERPSGHVLFPFADSPHITQEGFIIHVALRNHKQPPRSGPGGPSPFRLDSRGWHLETSFPIQLATISRASAYLTPAKRRAACWLTPQPERPQAPRPPPQFQVFRPHPAGRAGVYASQVSQDEYHEPPSASSHYDDRPQYQLPFMSLAQEAARRIPFIKTAAGNIMDLLRNCPLIGNGVAQRQAARAVHDIYQEMLELEEALEQLL